MPAITDTFVLPADVVLLPVADLPPQLRERLDYEEQDVAITRVRSRQPSKIVSAETAALLQEFSSAKTIVEAILHYSLSRHSDPYAVLDSAFPVIQQFVNAELLLPADAPDVERIEATLVGGAQVDAYTIVDCVQVLQDTEVYQARQADGTVVALKIMRAHAGPTIARRLAHEAVILGHLAGRGAPQVLATGTFEGRAYIVQSWCAGISVTDAADELRADPGVGRARLLALCIAVLEAYAVLHAQGIIHGDVHPNNILIDGSGAVHLIDFGLARSVDPALPLAEPPRGGVAFFFEPEYAQACLAQQPPPQVQAAGEQYALAALVYHLLTGAYYLNFALEQARMLQQIAEHEPLPFADQGSPPWPAVERVLVQALSKVPAERFADVATFAVALRAIAEAERGLSAGSTTQARPRSREAETLLSAVLHRVGWAGPLLNAELPLGPTASVNYGAAGIAYMLYRVACVRGDPELLALADVWATRAAGDVAHEAGFYNAQIEITPATVGRISPYHTPSGVFAVQALLARAMGDPVAQERAVRSFVAAVQQPCDNLDLTLGWSSVLAVGALLLEALPTRAAAESSGLLALGETTLQRIWTVLDRYPSVRFAPEMAHLGIAHGWAGVLYATLRWCETSGSALPSSVAERLRQVAACTELVGRGGRWPWRLDSPATGAMAGWCNGSAGYVFLWTLAQRLLGDPRYGTLAELAAWNSWEDPAPSPNLCCGLAGRGYALLRWYKVTRDPSWVRRAELLAERAAVNARTLPLDEYRGLEHSLYKGETGIAALVADLACPETAALPFFEAEG